MPAPDLQNKKQQVFLSLCFLSKGERGSDYFRFLSEDQEKILVQYAAQLGPEKMKDRAFLSKQILTEEKETQAETDFFSIHPFWIFEKLESEPPFLLSLAVDFLSPEKRKIVLDLVKKEGIHLPRRKKIHELDPEIQKLVSDYLFEKFRSVVPKESQVFSFQHLSCLDAKDLSLLFRDVGIEEICRGFFGTDEKLFKAFAIRFPEPLSEEIRYRMKKVGRIPKETKKNVQKHLVSMNLDSDDGETLFREVGMSCLARALGVAEETLAERIWQKFDEKEGSLVREAWMQNREYRKSGGDPDLREILIQRLLDLSKKGKIKKYWKEH